MRKRYPKVPSEVRSQVIRLAARGATYNQIIEQLDMSVGAVSKVLRPLGGVYRAPRPDSPHRLSLEDRVEIRVGLERGWTYAQIGAAIGRHASTVCREVNTNGSRDTYRPMGAHEAAYRRARRPKPAKLAGNRRLHDRVVADLERLWSPQQISRRLKLDFGDDVSMQISHETIYQSLYVQGRGALRKELAACLRTGRARRRPQGRTKQGARIADMVMVSERPAEVADRAVPGHWEGDLIVGKQNRSAIGTLVERTTRFVMLLHLPDGHNAEAVRTAMTDTIVTLPEGLRRTLTWDQGKEMAQHLQFSIDTGVDVYFCDPHSPWQRGSNENTNGLLRQYLPKGTDLSVHSAADLQAIADSLNGRPRHTLGWKTPSEALTDLLVATTA